MDGPSLVPAGRKPHAPDPVRLRAAAPIGCQPRVATADIRNHGNTPSPGWATIGGRSPGLRVNALVTAFPGGRTQPSGIVVEGSPQQLRGQPGC